MFKSDIDRVRLLDVVKFFLLVVMLWTSLPMVVLSIAKVKEREQAAKTTEENQIDYKAEKRNYCKEFIK